MRDQILEPDWKYMRKLHDTLLERYCARVNARTAAILMEIHPSQYERRTQVYEHVIDSDRVLADCFDDWRRSRLVYNIAHLRRHGLFTDEEYTGLSEETRGLADFLAAEQAERAERRPRRR